MTISPDSGDLNMSSSRLPMSGTMISSNANGKFRVFAKFVRRYPVSAVVSSEVPTAVMRRSSTVPVDLVASAYIKPGPLKADLDALIDQMDLLCGGSDSV